ncbi:MAG: Smr/MutS family protein [Patescibacteria group bacterium]
MPNKPGSFDSLMEEYTRPEDIEAALAEKRPSEEAEFKNTGELVKDYPHPQRETDLHGMTGSEAMFELENFINRSIQQRIRTVRVITGKGLHSQNMKSVLPEMTEGKLAELRRAGKILAFRREKTGGSFVVYLVS